MAHPALTRALLAAACALPVLAAGCGDDEPISLFDEEGTWVLTLFRLEDGDMIGGFGSVARENKFMINFDRANKLVSAAACDDSAGNQKLTQSLCDQGKEEGGYYCRCFTYEFKETTMTWTEFVPDGQPTPPAPTEEGIPGPMQPVQINLSEYPDISNTYRYQPLPFGLFDSNGRTSEYVFQERSPMAFDATGCKEICGGAPAM